MGEAENAFESAFLALEETAKNSIHINEGDYVDEEGLLVCCKCHTRKQCKVELFGIERTPYCLCKCEAEKRDREEDEYKRREQEAIISDLRKMGFPESNMAKWTFANDDGQNQKLTNICMNYVKNFAEMRKKGKGLLLFGETGTGKTFYAACIANALIDRGFPCIVTNFVRITNTISGMYEGKQEYLDKLNRFPLLVLDDLASERDTEFMNESIQNIIDGRYRAGLPTIVTTNLTSDEIKHPADISRQRPYSRLLEMCIPVEVKGRDRRREKLKDDYADLKDLLGL